ncbi:flagellin [Sphingomonas sp. RT2P30]|uniref:flagellin n=1 Tax=Parasphingomonas halimpatiens TaxID=3096162 RepID=UPI002FC71A4B
MSRVATIPLQRTMSAAIQHAQQSLAKTQQQLSTGKKAADFAALGTEAVRNLSTHSLLAQQDAYVGVAGRIGTTLTLNDANMSAIDTAASALKQSLLTAVGTGRAPGLSDAISAAFDQFRASLNASDGGVSLFGGSQTDGPAFLPNNIAGTLGVPPAAAFANDGVKASARLADGLDVQYGVTASDIGSGLYSAFQTLAAAGAIGETPTQAQLDALSQAAGQIETGLAGLRTVNAENGRKQAQVEALGSSAGDRSLLMQGIITNNEDADLGQVAIDLAQQKMTLQASYSVFSQLSGLSLASYLH